MYKPFEYLLSRESDHAMEKFISRNHSLIEYRRELDELKVMELKIAQLPVYIPMNLFLLDCTHINKVSVRLNLENRIESPL